MIDLASALPKMMEHSAVCVQCKSFLTAVGLGIGTGRISVRDISPEMITTGLCSEGLKTLPHPMQKPSTLCGITQSEAEASARRAETLRWLAEMEGEIS